MNWLNLERGNPAPDRVRSEAAITETVKRNHRE
jgi:hypothetical protein